MPLIFRVQRSFKILSVPLPFVKSCCFRQSQVLSVPGATVAYLGLKLIECAQMIEDDTVKLVDLLANSDAASILSLVPWDKVETLKKEASRHYGILAGYVDKHS